MKLIEVGSVPERAREDRPKSMHGWALRVLVFSSATMPAEDPSGRGCEQVVLSVLVCLVTMVSPIAPVIGLRASKLYSLPVVCETLKSALNWSITFWMVSEPTPTKSVVAGELASETFSLPVLAFAQVILRAKVCGSGDGGGHSPASLTIGAVVVPLLTCTRLVVLPLGAGNPVTLTGAVQPVGSLSLIAVSTPAATLTLGVTDVWAWAVPASPRTPAAATAAEAPA